MGKEKQTRRDVKSWHKSCYGANSFPLEMCKGWEHSTMSQKPKGADIRAEPLPGMSNIARTQQTPTELSNELFGCQMCQMWSYRNETQLYPQQPLIQQWEWAWESMQTEICPRWRNLFVKLAVKYIEICSITVYRETTGYLASSRC